MAETKTKVKTALDESRILVLGMQVLAGSEFTAVFQSSFSKLPGLSQFVVLGALGLMLVALTLIMSPAPYHQIVQRGEGNSAVARYVTRVIALALLPFALGLGLNLYVVTAKLTGTGAGLLAGGAAVVLALFFWYGLEALEKPGHEGHVQAAAPQEKPPAAGQRPPLDGTPRRGSGDGQAIPPAPEGPPAAPEGGQESGGTSIQDRVTHVLTEARVVLPGVQALIGFQFSSMFTDPFDRLPASSKYLHLGSIGLMAVAMILLMTPAAYHRIVEQGESTEHFHRFAARLVLAAMVPLALGISLEFFVIARKISDSLLFSGAGAVVLLLLFLGAWFGFTIWRRSQQGPAPSPP